MWHFACTLHSSIESMWTPRLHIDSTGLHVDSTWTPHGVLENHIFGWLTCGLHMNSTWSPHGVHMKSKGLYLNSTYTPEESTWTPHGLHMDSTWTPHRLHIDS